VSHPNDLDILCDMSTLTAGQARTQLQALLDQVAMSHQPVRIAGRKSAGVLISEEDWRAIEETLYLLSIPDMRRSIVKGLKTPVSKCAKRNHARSRSFGCGLITNNGGQQT
jgi:antitoxin YefM